LRVNYFNYSKILDVIIKENTHTHKDSVALFYARHLLLSAEIEIEFRVPRPQKEPWREIGDEARILPFFAAKWEKSEIEEKSC